MKIGITVTDKFIRGLKPHDTLYEVSDDKVAGLAIRVHPSGKKNFFVRYKTGNRRKRYTLNPDYPILSLSAARDRARELLVQVSKGNDPQASKVEEREAGTFKELVERYRTIYLPSLRPKTQELYVLAIDKYLLNEFAYFKPENIKRKDIIRFLDEIVYERKTPTMANRVKAVLSSILSFGVDKGVLEFNPALTVKPPAKEKPRERVLTDEEIVKVWQATGKESPVIRVLFRLLLLLGQRSAETRAMQWGDIKGDCWEISANSTKAGRGHIVPVPQLALHELRYLSRITGDSKYVFETPSNRRVGHIQDIHKALNRIKKSSGVDFRIHDMRRTLASGLARLKVNRTIIGKVLNHKTVAGDFRVTAIYDRYDYFEEKKEALSNWSNFLNILIKDKEPLHKVV